MLLLCYTICQGCEPKTNVASVVFSGFHRNVGRFRSFFFVFFCRNNANPKPNTSRSVSRSLSRPVSRENQLKDSISKDSACTCWYHVATRLVNRKLTENNNCLVGFSVFNRKFRSVSFFFFSLLWVVKQSRPKKTRRRFFGFIFWGYRKTY